MTTGYGRDSWCLTALVPGKFAHGRQLLIQSLYHRATTPRGDLKGLDDQHSDEESAYGFDVASYVGAVGYAVAVHAIPAILRAEWKKDDRVAEVFIDASITQDANGAQHIELVCAVLPVNEAQTFPLTLIVSDAALRIAA